MKSLVRIVITIGLILAGVIWLIENKIAKLFGRELKQNCFTYAFSNFDYFGGDGFFFSKSYSGWFPHTGIIKGASSPNRNELVIVEYVPVNRVPQKLPPRRFDGVVRVSHMKIVESKKS